MTTPTPEQKKRLKKLLSTALFVALILALCWYLWQNREEMRSLLRLDGKTVALMLLFALCGCVTNCFYHRIILSAYQVPLSLTDWMGVVFVANAIAYVLPMRADLVFSGVYYKRRKGLSYTKSASMAAGNIVFGVAFALLQMLAALVCTGLTEGVWSPVLWAVWAAGMLCEAAFVFFALRLQGKQPRLFQRYQTLRNLVEGFNYFLRNRSMLWRLLVCHTVNNLFQLLLYMVCFRAAGLPVTFYQALFYNSVSWMASILTIVPGNIGLKEAVMGLATSLMGALFQIGVAASLLQRVAVMIVYMVMGAAFAYPVWRNWNRPEKGEEGQS